MSQELLYTSAPRGLKPGSRGFCTVLCTQGMPAPLASALESLSGYRPLFSSNDERAHRNPVVHSHLKMQATGRTYHVLSRIADYGVDYSQRANKLAHHVIIDNQAELLQGGPANLLSMSGFMREEWSGDPKVVAMKPVTREPRGLTGPCRHWQEVTGDAGWAGVLAESYLKNPDRLAIIVFDPGQEILPLFAESISLLPPDKRWDVTFSTYFTGLATGSTCLWRAVVRDSKEAHESLRFVNALRIDLAATTAPATGGRLVEAARTGERTTPSNMEEHPEAPHGPSRARISSTSPQDALPPPHEPAMNSTYKLSPPSVTRNTSHPSPPSQRRNRTSIRRPTIHTTLNRWGWHLLAFAILISVSSVVVFSFSSTNKQQQQAQPPSNADPTTSPPDRSANGTSLPQTPPSPESHTEANEPSPSSANGTNQVPAQSNKSPQAPTTPITDAKKEPRRVYSNIQELQKLSIFEFTWNETPRPNYQHFFKLVKTPTAEKDFKNTFKRLPPTIQFLVPKWLQWSFTPAKTEQESEKTLLEIQSIDRDNSTAFSEGKISLLSRSTGKLEYQFKPAQSPNKDLLSWCGFRIEDKQTNTPDTPEVTEHLLHNPYIPPEDSAPYTIAWDTKLPRNDRVFDSSNFQVELTEVSFGSKTIKCNSKAWKREAHESIFLLQEILTKLERELDLKRVDGTPITLRFGAKEKTDTIHLYISIKGITDAGGWLAKCESILRRDAESICPKEANDFTDINDAIKGAIGMAMSPDDTARSSDPNFQKAIQEIKSLLSKRQPSDEKDDSAEKLRTIESKLNSISESLIKTSSRFATFHRLKQEVSTLRISAAVLSHELGAVTRKEPWIKLVDAPVVIYPPENNTSKGPQETGANQ
ncbi:hypothetical protein [Schlesneria sp. DSM 10557]|uniref:GAP1-N2 domain-containing protein n=1 Tax=Schlesneria sp. DSM 10557 TaxID=3044399 RepID=UPI00359F7891